MAEESNNPAVIAGKIVEAMINAKMIGTKGLDADRAKDAAEAFKTVHKAVSDAMNPYRK
jgi:hypothetical protein